MVAENIFHEFDEETVKGNLQGAYGTATGLIYEKDILPLMKGNRLLDAGCGFGLFTSIALKNKYHCYGIDSDENSLKIAQELYGIRCHRESVYQTSLPENSIDTVVFNDVIEHLDFIPLRKEIERLGARRIILYSSNLKNKALIIFRRLTDHKEHREYSLSDIQRELEKSGFTLTRLSYLNYIALPLTGGLKYRPLFTLRKHGRGIYLLDRFIKSLAECTKLGRYFAFRYVSVFDREEEKIEERNGNPAA